MQQDLSRERSALTSRSVRSFVVRGGRMTDSQRRSYDELSPRFLIPYQEARVDRAAAFGREAPLVIEIGFGMGIATAQIAEANPDINYLGIEVHRPGVGRLLWEIEQRGLRNLRIVEHDAVEVIEQMMPDDSIAAFHIFFPDPWPKKRHHKRRLVTRPFTDLLARKLAPDGYVYFVTDWREYGEWALAELSATEGLMNPYEGFAPPQEWRPETKFERKGLAKEHAVSELLFKKRGQA